MQRISASVIVLIAVIAAAGCAPPFPAETLGRVDRTISFSDLQGDAAGRRGQWVVLGGVIIETRNTEQGSYLEVLQKPLNGRMRPLRTDATAGRFLARSDQFLDAAVYQPGREITVVGEAAGSLTRRLGEVDYVYPLLAVRALHLWEPSSGPRFFFSFGLWHQH